MDVVSPLPPLELCEGEFHRRKNDAKRSGKPAWIWPEVPLGSWAEATDELATASATVLRGDVAHFSDFEPLTFSLACYISGMGPLLGWWLEANALTAPSAVGAVLNAHLHHARNRARYVATMSKFVIAHLANEGVRPIVLKGGHTAFAYFPDPATRPASDLDLLVPAAQAAKAESTLALAGLRCLSRTRRDSTWAISGERQEPRSIWLAHAEDPWSVDLHTSLDFSAATGAQLVHLDSADPFSTAIDWPPDHRAKALSQPLQLLQLAVHASGGLQNLTLLRLVELILVVRRDHKGGRLSWKSFLETAEQTGGLGAAYPALKMSEKMLPGIVPKEILDRCNEASPRRVRAIVNKLDPASAQRVERASIAEHFMWVSGTSGWLRQLGSDLFPPHSLLSIYQARAYRLLRGKISR
ncbi:MAG TPA: nucleotidyltransferase family protein [Sphingomicrobium sp.]|nr:nucleotidyltransferase family protein [Sphingomicrobium sp.]